VSRRRVRIIAPWSEHAGRIGVVRQERDARGIAQVVVDFGDSMTWWRYDASAVEEVWE
jgi:hypothetical protein